MSRSRFALLAVTLAVCLLPVLSAEAASAQRERRDRDVREPTELLREYPFSEGGRLNSRKRSEVPPERAERTAPTPPAAAADDSGDGDSIVLPIVAALGAAGLVVLAVGGRRVARAKGGRSEPQPPPVEPQPSPAAPPPRSGPQARSYAVVNQKGGVGKTTVSSRWAWPLHAGAPACWSWTSIPRRRPAWCFRRRTERGRPWPTPS